MANPTTARGVINRVLRDLGIQPSEYKVNTVRYSNKIPRALVVMTTVSADKKIAENDNVQKIQTQTAQLGAPFIVTVSYTRSRQPLVYIYHSYATAPKGYQS